MMKERFMQIVANKGRLSDEDVAVLTRWYDGNIYNTNGIRIVYIQIHTPILPCICWKIVFPFLGFNNLNARITLSV